MLPFKPLQPSQRVGCRVVRLFAAIHESIRVAIVGTGQLINHVVTSDTAKPIFGIAEITLATMHDTVPKAPFRTAVGLTDFVSGV